MTIEIGENHPVCIAYRVKFYLRLIDDCIAAHLTNFGFYLLRFVGAHKIISENVLDPLYAFFDTGIIIGGTVHSQQIFQHIDGHISALFNFLCPPQSRPAYCTLPKAGCFS